MAQMGGLFTKKAPPFHPLSKRKEFFYILTKFLSVWKPILGMIQEAKNPLPESQLIFETENWDANLKNS